MPAGVGSLLGMLLAVVAILALAWWVTSLIARQGTLALPGRLLQVLQVIFVCCGKSPSAERNDCFWYA